MLTHAEREHHVMLPHSYLSTYSLGLGSPSEPYTNCPTGRVGQLLAQNAKPHVNPFAALFPWKRCLQGSMRGLSHRSRVLRYLPAFSCVPEAVSHTLYLPSLSIGSIQERNILRHRDKRHPLAVSLTPSCRFRGSRSPSFLCPWLPSEGLQGTPRPHGGSRQRNSMQASHWTGRAGHEHLLVTKIQILQDTPANPTWTRRSQLSAWQWWPPSRQPPRPGPPSPGSC